MLNSNDGLLTFDDDSPLFVTKKTKKKRKQKNVPVTVEVDYIQVEVPKRRQKRKVKKIINNKTPKYMIKSPADCKHILPAFKKKLMEKWKILDTNNSIKVSEFVNYLRGVANVAKKSRPKEYEELRVLMSVVKK